MASMKAEKPAGTQPASAQPVKKEPPKEPAAMAVPAAFGLKVPASKPAAPKKAEQKPQEPKKKASPSLGSKPAGK